MTDQNLRELLEKLHHELERAEGMDEQGRELLRHLDADIRNLLKRSDTKAEADQRSTPQSGSVDEPLMERLQDSIDHFEATHPRLTMMLSEMMTILSNAGI